VLWKQETFGVLRPLQIEFFRNLLENFERFATAILQAPAKKKKKQAKKPASEEKPQKSDMD
jgi:hypothetical protein